MEILPAGQAVLSCGNAAVHHIGIAATTGLDGFRIDNGVPNLPIRTPFQEEYRTGQGIAQGIDFLNVDFTGPEGIGKGNRSRCTGSYHHRLGILAVAEVQGILGDDFLHRVGSGSQLAGENHAVLTCGKGRAGDLLPGGIRYPEHPASGGSAVCHGFDNLKQTVLCIGVGHGGVLAGCDGGVLLHLYIVFPVGSVPVMDFLDRVISGEQILTDCPAIPAGSKGFHQGVALPDFKLPAFRTAVDGVLLHHDSAPVDIVDGDGCGLTGNHRNGVTGGIQLPVGVAASNFPDDVLPGRKIGSCGQALGIGGNGFYHLVCGFVHDFKLPSGEVLPGVGGFLHLDLAFQLHSQTEAAGDRVYGTVQHHQLLPGIGIGLILVNSTGFGSFAQFVSTGLHHQLIQLLGSGFRSCHLQGVSAPGEGQTGDVGGEMEICQHAIAVCCRAGVKPSSGILFQGDGAGHIDQRGLGSRKTGNLSVLFQFCQKFIIFGLYSLVCQCTIKGRRPMASF